MAGPRLTNLEPLPEFGQSPLERELRKLGRLIANGNPNPAANRFAADLETGKHSALFAIGFLDGFWSGVSDRAAAWARDCQDTLTRLRDLLLRIDVKEIVTTVRVGLATSIWEFFRRPPLTIADASLSASTIDALKDLALLHDLYPFFQWLEFFEDKRRTSSFLGAVSDLAESIAIVLLGEARSELHAILVESDPERQGARVGRLIGGALVEMVRAIAEPTAFTVAEMITILELEPEEMHLLDLQGAAIP